MKVVILAGGLGTRISEESHLRPKPMIEIGKYPILVHIMRIYAAQGFNEFIICAGYKQQVIKEYFAHFDLYTNDVTFDIATGERTVLKSPKFNWKVTIADTGSLTKTGGRIRRVKEYIGDEPFLLTYGDAVGDLDIHALIDSHIKSGKSATISVYSYAQSKGVVNVGKDGSVRNFREKNTRDNDLINIGFMVINPDVLNLIENDNSVLENDVLPQLAKNGQLNAYIHTGFWQCMDTTREKEYLENLESQPDCPWKVWKNVQ